MADLVGLQAQTPDIMGKLSQLLHIQGQRAQVQQEQQTARQRANLAKYDWNKHIGEDGTLDLNTLNDPELMQAAGDQYLDVVTRAVQAKQQQVEAKRTLVGLRNDQRKAFGDMMTALRSDQDVAQDNQKGRQKVNQAMIQYGEMYGDDALPVLSAYAPNLQKVPKGRMSDALRAIGMQAQDVSTTIAQQQPQYTDTGAQLTQINPNAAAGAAGIPLTLPPGAQIVTDAAGRQYQLNPQTNTVQPIGTGVAPSAPPRTSARAPSGFQQPVPQQKEIEDQIVQTRKADADYGLNRHVNEQILRLSKDTTTGPGTDAWHHMLGAVAGPLGGNNVADYQTIGAYLDRQAALSAKQMGLPDTNAGLATAASLSGTTGYQPKALQTKVHLTDALVEGAHQYRQGLDKIIGTGPTQDLSRYPAYQAAWASNFDPNIFRAENALKRLKADPNDEVARTELNDIKKEVGPKGMAELKRKSDALHRLSAGEIP